MNTEQLPRTSNTLGARQPRVRLLPVVPSPQPASPPLLFSTKHNITHAQIVAGVSGRHRYLIGPLRGRIRPIPISSPLPSQAHLAGRLPLANYHSDGASTKSSQPLGNHLGSRPVVLRRGWDSSG